MKSLIAVTVLACATVMGAGEAQGQFFDGNDLYNLSVEYKRNPVDSNRNDFAEGVFLGFVMGVHDASKGVLFCPPADKPTIKPLVDSVARYLEEQPDVRYKAGNVLVAEALAKAFPCKKKK